MGNNHSFQPNIDALCKTTKTNTTQCKILLIGTSHSGKSCCLNTISRIICGPDSWPLQTGRKGGPTTYRVRSLAGIEEKTQLQFYDIPGANYSSKIVQTDLERFVTAEQINFVVVVVSGPEISDRGWFGSVNRNSSWEYLNQVVTIAQEKTVGFHEPYLLCTKTNESGVTKELLVKWFGRHVPPDNILAVENYTEQSQSPQNQSTELTYCRFLSALLETYKLPSVGPLQ